MNASPFARRMKTGVPPTLRKARTGELTPPGIDSDARLNNSSLLLMLSGKLNYLNRVSGIEQTTGVLRKISGNDPCPCPFDGSKRFEYCLILIQPSHL